MFVRAVACLLLLFPATFALYGSVFSLGFFVSKLGPWVGIVTFFGLAALLFVGLSWLIDLGSERTDRLRLERIVAKGGEVDPILQSAAEFLRSRSRRPLEWLATGLFDAGHSGICVRFACRGAFWPVAAIRTPFEALPMDEFDLRFTQFRSPSAAPPKPSGLLESIAKRIGKDDAAQVLRRFSIRGYWLHVAFVFMLVYAIVESVQRGSISTWFYVYAISTALAAVFLLWSGRFKGIRYSLLPGGLLVRTTSEIRSAVQLHVFDRQGSVLCVAPATRGFWHWAAYDGCKRAGATVTSAEIEVMLAAWLSPVRPPAVEQLAELA